MRRLLQTLCLIVTAVFGISAQEIDTTLTRHNFFYAGQSKQRRMFIVKDGQIGWNYDDQLKRGEISDAILMADGHILLAHQYGIAEVTQKSETVWSYAAPEVTEIHTIQPIGNTHVVFVQNGKPAKTVVMEIPSRRIVREFVLPTNEKGSVHGQFRNARLSSRGTYLIANMAMGCVHEFTADGKEVDRWTGMLPWSVEEMPKTGNLLITGRKGLIQEINRQGQTVWQMNTTNYGVTQPQKTVRLKNGNHLVNNWYNEWPCYLCNQSTLLCILAALIDHQGIMSYCVTVGTIGALLAVFMPDRYNRDQLLFSKQAFGFYGYHGLLIATCLSFYTTGVYEAKPVHALWDMGITFLLAVIAHVINLLLRKSGLNPKANYVYTCEPDNFIFEKLYRLVPIRLLYLIPVMLAFGMISFIALSVM